MFLLCILQVLGYDVGAGTGVYHMGDRDSVTTYSGAGVFCWVLVDLGISLSGRSSFAAIVCKKGTGRGSLLGNGAPLCNSMFEFLLPPLCHYGQVGSPGVHAQNFWLHKQCIWWETHVEFALCGAAK